MKSKELRDFYDNLKIASDPLVDIEEYRKSNMAYIHIQQFFRERVFLGVFDNQAGSSFGSPYTITCVIEDPLHITDTLKFEFSQEENTIAAAHYDPPNTIFLYANLKADTEDKLFENLYEAVVENGQAIIHEYTHHIDMNRMKDTQGYLGYLDRLEEQLYNSNDFKSFFNNTYWNLPHETNAYLVEGMGKIYQDIFVKLRTIESRLVGGTHLNSLRKIFYSFDSFTDELNRYIHPQFMMFTSEENDKKIRKRLYKFYTFMHDIVSANLSRFNLAL